MSHDYRNVSIGKHPVSKCAPKSAMRRKWEAQMLADQWTMLQARSPYSIRIKMDREYYFQIASEWETRRQLRNH